MLAYLQLRPPLADVVMQKGEVPIVCDFCMVLPVEGEPIVPCAWANETPAISAATAVIGVSPLRIPKSWRYRWSGYDHLRSRQGMNSRRLHEG